MPSKVTEAVRLTDAFVRKSEKSETQVVNAIVPVIQAAVESEVVSISASLEKSREEPASELDALRVEVELVSKEHRVALAEMREQGQNEVEARKAKSSRKKATLSRVRDKTPDEGKRLFSARDIAAARYREFSNSICRVVKPREDHKDRAVDTSVKLRSICDEGRRVIVEAYVAEWIDFRERVVSLTNYLESKRLELQTILGLVMKAARLRKQI